MQSLQAIPQALARAAPGLQHDPAGRASCSVRLTFPGAPMRHCLLPVAGQRRPSVQCRTATQDPSVNTSMFGVPPNALLTSESMDFDDDGEFDFDAEIQYLEALADRLMQATNLEDKVCRHPVCIPPA